MTYSTAASRLGRWKAVVGLAAAGAALLAFTASAGAAVIQVAPDNSSGTDNLSAAITQANGNSDPSNILVLTGSGTTGRYAPLNALPPITKTLTITSGHAVQAANGTPAVYVDGSAVSNPNTDLFTISSGVNVTLEGFGIQDASNLGNVAVRDNGNLTMYGMALIANNGVGLAVSTGASAVLNESIVDGNSENNGVSTSGTLTLNNSNVTNNWSGGIGQSGGVVTLNNSLVANNNVGGLGTHDCTGFLGTDKQDDSMDDDGTCHVTFSNEQFWNTNGNFPQPGTNGGPTASDAMPTGSPSIGVGDPAKCPTVDQRFFVIPSGSCDVGAWSNNATQDTTPPACVVTNLIIGPPKQQQVTVTDPGGSGLGPEAGTGTDTPNSADAISNLVITNGSVSFTPFTAPSTGGLVLTATKTDQATLTHWNFTATNWAGISKFCN